MEMDMVTIEVTHTDNDKLTIVHGETIEIAMTKLQSFHTLDDTMKHHFIERNCLEDEVASGWWFKE